MAYQISTEHQRGFIELLNRVDISGLDEGIYHERYLRHLLIHKDYYIRIYTHVLNLALDAVGVSPANLRFVDYGAGNGLLGFFAAFCGFRNVLLVDSNPSFTEAAARLSIQISVPVDGILAGELDRLEEFLGTDKPDIIAGTDVIEHIYDLNSFFKQIHGLNPSVVTVFTTASNPGNPIKVRWLKKIQNKDEYEGGAPEDHSSEGDQPAFLDIRREIIRSSGIIDMDSAEALAVATRGLRKDDIENAVNQFRLSGELPDRLRHATNTCHPLTGNWTERILEIEEYREIYHGNGFSMTVHSGFYNADKGFPLSLLFRAVNAILPFLNLLFSPFITLVGRKI